MKHPATPLASPAALLPLTPPRGPRNHPTMLAGRVSQR